MLSRFTKIKNIGKFCDSNPAGKSFEKKTIIFGSNGHGKSTLTAILRSLTENNPQHIKERKTFGTTSDQQVEIIFSGSAGNQPMNFSGGQWDNAFPNILIFDSKFISQNIFDGERLLESHKANLHRVVVGLEGKRMAENIERLGRSIRIQDQENGRKNQEYRRATASQIMTIDSFVELENIPNLDTKIDELEKELEFAGLTDKPKIPEINSPDLSDYEGVLSRNTSAIHTQAKVAINDHIKKHWKDSEPSQTFLSDGLNRLNLSNNCPFCGQGLEAVSELIDAYRSFFDEDYRSWERDVNRRIQEFRFWNIGAEITSVESRVNEWKRYLEVDCNNLLSWLGSKKEIIIKAKEAFEAECQKKISNPEHSVDFSSLHTLIITLEELVNQVQLLNQKIEAHKLRIGRKNIVDITKRLKEHLAVKERYQPAWQQFCAEYQQIKLGRSRLGTERDAAINELNDYSSNTFASHQSRINEVLEYLGADFRLDNFTERTDRRRSGAIFCGFDLVFFDRHSVEAHEGQGHNFHNTLSQGDKNLLAFAFFMASVWNEKELHKKIIVVDDPISSFDHERKLGTINLLAQASNSDGKLPEQIIILTHELNFLGSIYRHRFFEDAKYLKIVPDGKTENDCKKSKLEDCNVESEYLKPREDKYLEEIQEMIDGNKPIPSDAHDKCRIVLERAFKAKYHLQFRELPPRSGVSSFVEKLVEIGIYDQEKQSKLQPTLDKIQEPHHATSSGNVEDSEGDLKLLLRETLEALSLI